MCSKNTEECASSSIERHLDLASDEQTIARGGPFGIQVLEHVNRRAEVGTLRQSLLHGAFDQAIGEREATRQGQRLGYNLCGTHL